MTAALLFEFGSGTNLDKLFLAQLQDDLDALVTAINDNDTSTQAQIAAIQASITAIQAEIDGLASSTQLLGINTQTASYTLALIDAGYTVEMNVGSANTLTVPPNATIAFPVKTFVNVVQLGAGQTTLTPGAGVTLRSRSGLKLSGQYAMGTIYQRAANEWVCGGSLTS